MAYTFHLVAIVSIALFNTLSLNLIFGKGKILHFGSIAVSLVATYGTFLTLEATHSYVLGILVGLAAALLLSMLLWWLSLRMEPDGYGVLSIAVHLVILSIILNWSSLTHGALGIPRIPRMPLLDSTASFAIVAACCAILWIIALYFLQRTAYGRQLQALAEHEKSAASLGIHRSRVHLIAFLIGGVGALLANIFYVQYVHLAHPNDFMFASLITYLTIVVAGGPGNVLGVTLSAVFLTLLLQGLRFLSLPPDLIGSLQLILFGVILLGAVWVRRDSLFPAQRKV